MTIQKSIAGSMMGQLIAEGRATLLCYTGLQHRPVYEVDGVVYERSIDFNDNQPHDDFYQVSTPVADYFRQVYEKGLKA